MRTAKIVRLIESAKVANDKASALYKAGSPQAHEAGIAACLLFEQVKKAAPGASLKVLVRA